MTVFTRKLGAVPVYLLLAAGGTLFSTLVFTVNLVYQVQVARLNPLQLVLVGTVLEGAAFLFEIPTGVVADVYSRRLSIIIGVFLLGIGLALQGAVPDFGVILLAQVIWGIGYTFTSGATQAWITDEIGVEQANALFLRGAQAELVAAIAGVVVATAIANFSLRAPILLGGALYLVMGLVLLAAMPETGFQRTPRAARGSWQQLGDTLRAGGALVRRSPALLTMLAIFAIAGAATESYDRLSTAHFLANFAFPTRWGLQPVAWLGIFAVVGRLLSIGVLQIVVRRVNPQSHRAVARALTLATALLALCYLGFALAGTLALAAIASIGVRMCRTVSSPLQAAWINQHVASRVRATVLSITSQADAIGQTIGGPVIGYVGLIASLRAALALAAVILSPTLALYARTLRHDTTLAVDTGADVGEVVA